MGFRTVPIAVDLFCGAGGSSLGLTLAGFRVAGALDADPVACRTYERNLGVRPLCADAFTISATDFMEYFGLRRGCVDVMVGCPPCQGFSQLGAKRLDDHRNFLVDLFANWVRTMMPAVVIFENVPGILKTGYEYLIRLFRALDGLYDYHYAVLNAADYGIAQRRRRLILLAARRSCFDSPPPFPPKETTRRTVRDAIGHLPPLNAGEAHPEIPNHRARRLGARTLSVLRAIPPDGGSRRVLPEHLILPCHKRRRRGFEDVYGRLRWDEVAPTLTSGCTDPTKGRFVHPEQDRGLTAREAAALQSFPDSFVFDGSLDQVDRQVGNAFPPLLMRAVGEAIAEWF